MELNTKINEIAWINVSNYSDLIIKWIINYIPNIFWAILVLWIWFKIVNLINRGFLKAMNKAELDPMLKSFISSLVTIILKILVFISAAWIIWVETSSFVAMLAAAGLAIGMALSGTLQNFAGWVMILVFKPYKIWDYIEVNSFIWTVKEIHIFNTIVLTIDRKIIIIPNADIINNAMTNYSTEPLRRLDLIIWISYNSDIDLAKNVLKDLIEKEERIFNKEESIINVWELWESSVNINFRFFIISDDYIEMKWIMLEKVKKAFDKNKITFPFPQRDIHMYSMK